jgi:uncharacterized protein YraI
MEFYAEKDMNWVKWCNSDYNTIDATCTSHTTVSTKRGNSIYDSDGSTLEGVDPIISGASYTTNPSAEVITFTIDNKLYYAEAGMNWEDWCNSDYNVEGWSCAENSQVTKDNANAIIDGDTYVEGGIKIISDNAYTTEK